MPRFPWAALGLTTTALSVLFAPMAAFADPSPTSVHVVQQGDTLLQIALDAGTDTDTIVALNGLSNADVLSVGESIKVPAHAASPSGTTSGTTSAASTSTPAAAATATAASYTIASGDSLWDIAQRFGTTPDAIVQLNHLDDPDHLSVGTVLSMPPGAQPRTAASAASGSAGSGGSSSSSASSVSGSSPSVSAAVPAATLVISSTNASAKRTLMVSYTVQPGETLMQIAHRFDVAADTIVQATNLSDANLIVVGSVLKVPVPAKAHVVADGETLRDIAASEKVDLGSLIDFNQIADPALIRVGQVVLLPVADTRQAVAATLGGSTTATSSSSSSSSSSATPTPTPAATPAPTSAPATPTAVASPTAVATQAAVATATASDTSGGGVLLAPSASPTQTSTQVAASVPASASPSLLVTTSPTPVASTTPAASGSTSTSASTTSSPVATATAMPGTSATPSPAGAPSAAMAATALKLLGSPYIWGGASPKGFDCSGFVWYVAKLLNKQVSRGMLGQYDSGSHPSRDALQPGDLVFFQNTWTPGLSHNGIYIGNNQFVNAADESTGVTISNLNTAYWSAHWFGATRLP